MANDIMKERFEEIERLAIAAGLKPFDVHFFEVPTSFIYEVASYGLPTRYSHWSFGKVHKYQRTQGEMGFSKIYELILNNDPSYAFLDKNNTSTSDLMICAHCLAHSDFFRNNIMFINADETSMIQVAKHHAEAIDTFRKDYGDDEVDEWIDVALSLEQHIDPYKGRYRDRYPDRHVEYTDRTPLPWEDVASRKQKPLTTKVIKGIHIPPYPERDILWFLSEYANVEPWQRRIFEIVRRESYYFFPQFKTKIMNEGWASYWHAELMHQYALGNDNDYGVKDIKHPLTSEEHLDFLTYHEKVVQPGLKIPLKVEVPEIDPLTNKPTGRKQKAWNPRIVQSPGILSRAIRTNPYYIGFRMFRNIKDRWDKYYKDGFRLDEWDNEIPVTIDGRQKIREVMEEEDDVSFFRNYLTEELVEELHLFAYGNTDKYNDNYGIQEHLLNDDNDGDTGEDIFEQIDDQIVENKTVIVKSKDVDSIIRSMAVSRSNYGVPCLVIRRIDEAGLLRLEHLQEDSVNLDIDYAKHVIKYIARAWGRPVELIRKDKSKTWIMTYDGTNFEINHHTPDYPECIEDTDVPSSW